MSEQHLPGEAVRGIEGTLREVDEVLLGFTRALRASGVPVTHDRAQSYLVAAAAVGLGDAAGVRTAGRATLCGSPDDLARHDQVHEAYFNARDGLPREQAMPAKPPAIGELMPMGDDDAGDGRESEDTDPIRAMASAVEVLRHRDVAQMTAGEKQRMNAMFATLRPRPPLRRTSRRRGWHRGELDASRTLRDSMRRMGEPGQIRWRRRDLRPRRVVLLIDVSGSMSAYADALLRLAHRITHPDGRAADGGRVETFTVGTRLTHLTRALRIRDPERALIAAGESVPDWSGGTRLGETLAMFLDRWGQRGMARGAVVVMFSDGWERGDAAQLGEQVARLHRMAHRVIWVNPHRGKDGYEPIQQGVLAVLPHVDDFLAGHSLATYAELIKVMEGGVARA